MLAEKNWETQKLSKPSAARSSSGRRLAASRDSAAMAWRLAREMRLDTESQDSPSLRPMALSDSQEDSRRETSW